MKSQHEQLHEASPVDFHGMMKTLSDVARINKRFGVSSSYTGIYAEEFKGRKIINEKGELNDLGYQWAELYDNVQKNQIIYSTTKSMDVLIQVFPI